jgi:hypothetical protein
MFENCWSWPSFLSYIENPWAFLFQSARGLGGPIPRFIGGAYVRFSMVDVSLFDVMSKIVGHGGGVTLVPL